MRGKSLRRVSTRAFAVKAASLPLSECSAIFSAYRFAPAICRAKGLLLLSVSPPFWDSEDDEDPAILEIVAQERQKLPGEAFLDFGPALPTHYDVDQVELMVQSPVRVFAYWELREATIASGSSVVFPTRDRQNFQLLLKWKGTRLPPGNGVLDPGTTDQLVVRHAAPESLSVAAGACIGASMAGFLMRRTPISNS